ncbi:MAG: CUAEP/CCAEP-tail radical SAM (seleno)protein [Thermomicrobiales bacterium]
MNVLLLSTYELGRQSFSVSSAAAWLKRAHAEVRTMDLAIERLDRTAVRWADVVCFSVPMHTATRIAVRLAARVRQLNPNAHLCFFGLYASVNEELFRSLGAGTILGGEFEPGLVEMVERLSGQQSSSEQTSPLISLERLDFVVPDRSGLPRLSRYAFLTMPDGSQRVAGYTESTRGCKHLCRHCPVVPVYGGNFRIVPREIVLADISQQVDAGAQHITFGDPDFLNGPGHARRIVEELHRRWPTLSYDVTIKVEHLARHSEMIPLLRDTGCVMITSAVESIDEHVLTLLDKRHTPEEFERVVHSSRACDLAFNPTFVTFTPWTTAEGYVDLLDRLAALDLVENVSPVQYGIRLLIPSGSRLLELDETQRIIEPFDPVALVYPWRHPDPRMDELHQQVLAIVQEDQTAGASRTNTWLRVSDAASRLVQPSRPRSRLNEGFGIPPVPRLSEPWYC